MRKDLFTNFLSARNFTSLDGLRFFSIIAVIFHHSTNFDYPMVLGRGFLGVDFFFVISGFLIVTLLLRERDITKNISLRKFYMRRALRIFPLYYGVIGAYFILYKFILTNSDFGDDYVSEIWIYLTYTANFFPVAFGIVWSLAAEEQFYLIWPAIEKYFKHFTITILAVLIILNQVINFPIGKLWLTEILGAQIFDQSITQTTFTPILLGVLIAHLLNKRNTFTIIARLTSYKAMPWFYLLILILLCQFSPPDISGSPRLMIQICMALLIASCVIRQDHYLTPILTFQPIKRIGEISYGLYLLHLISIVIVIKILNRYGVDNSIAVFIFGTILSITLAEISFRFYEQPFLLLKRKFSVAKQQHI